MNLTSIKQIFFKYAQVPPKPGELAAAAQRGELDRVLGLLARGVTPNDKKGYIQLDEEAREQARLAGEKRYGITRHGLSSIPPSPSIPEGQGWYAVTCAASREWVGDRLQNYPKILRALADAGADFSVKDHLGYTALDRALVDRKPDVSFIQVILDIEMEKNLLTQERLDSALLMAAQNTSDFERYKIVQMLIDRGANPSAVDPHTGLNAALYALRRKDPLTIQVLHRSGADFTQRIEKDYIVDGLKGREILAFEKGACAADLIREKRAKASDPNAGWWWAALPDIDKPAPPDLQTTGWWLFADTDTPARAAPQKKGPASIPSL